LYLKIKVKRGSNKNGKFEKVWLRYGKYTFYTDVKCTLKMVFQCLKIVM